ncbi:MAG: hypothetical protein ACK40M_11275, partial [Flavobacteriales bacterium]
EVITPLPQQIQNTVAIQRYFSSTKEKDDFVITIRGENYLKAKVCFSIINKAGDTLFVRHSDGRTLLSIIEPEKIKTEDQQMKMTRERMSTFFAENGFSNPPYTLNDPIKSGITGDKELWKEIENDSTAWCFEFSLSKGGGVEVISYSRLRDTILVYDSSQ